MTNRELKRIIRVAAEYAAHFYRAHGVSRNQAIRRGARVVLRAVRWPAT